MDILVTKKAKENLNSISEKELNDLKEFIHDMDYTGVAKGKLDGGGFFTVDFYKSKDGKCVIADFFRHQHENDAYNSYLDFISARRDENGVWLI